MSLLRHFAFGPEMEEIYNLLRSEERTKLNDVYAVLSLDKRDMIQGSLDFMKECDIVRVKSGEIVSLNSRFTDFTLDALYRIRHTDDKSNLFAGLYYVILHNFGGIDRVFSYDKKEIRSKINNLTVGSAEKVTERKLETLCRVYSYLGLLRRGSRQREFIVKVDPRVILSILLLGLNESKTAPLEKFLASVDDFIWWKPPCHLLEEPVYDLEKSLPAAIEEVLLHLETTGAIGLTHVHDLSLEDSVAKSYSLPSSFSTRKSDLVNAIVCHGGEE